MPGLGDNAGLRLLGGVVAENKAVIGAVFDKPLVGTGVSEAVLNRVEVYRKSELMLACAGKGNDGGGLFSCILVGDAGVGVLDRGYLTLKVSRLEGVGALGRANVKVYSVLFGRLDHSVEIIHHTGVEIKL